MPTWSITILIVLGFILLLRSEFLQSAKENKRESKIREQRDLEEERIELLQKQIRTLQDQSRERDWDILRGKISADQKKNRLPKHLGEYYKNPIRVDINGRGIVIYWKKTSAIIGYNMDDSNQYEAAIIKALSLSKTEALSSLKREIQRQKDRVIKEFPGNPKIKILNLKGRIGPSEFNYIKSGGKSFPIPRDTNPETLDRAACEELIKVPPKKRGSFLIDDYFDLGI